MRRGPIVNSGRRTVDETEGVIDEAVEEATEMDDALPPRNHRAKAVATKVTVLDNNMERI